MVAARQNKLPVLVALVCCRDFNLAATEDVGQALPEPLGHDLPVLTQSCLPTTCVSIAC